MRTFELLRANIILILFTEGGESGKFCPYFAVCSKMSFLSSTNNDRNSQNSGSSGSSQFHENARLFSKIALIT